ncbi:MAG: hypothetical protein WDN06_21035 [Asticcacaulis sp.]
MEGDESRRPAIDFSPEAAAILWPSKARTGGERPALRQEALKAFSKAARLERNVASTLNLCHVAGR